MDHRFLAERFRSALFMTLVGIDVTIVKPPQRLSLAYSPKDWIVAAFLSVWRQRPQPKIGTSSLFNGLKLFVCGAWIENQIRYHDTANKRHYNRHYWMSVASYAMFGLTVCTALLHIANLGPHLLETSFAFMAIVSPAIAASITAIRTQRDYLRNSMRSAEMARHLTELKNKIMLSQDYDKFLELLKETEETMLNENEDWRVVVRFHKPEMPV